MLNLFFGNKNNQQSNNSNNNINVDNNKIKNIKNSNNINIINDKISNTNDKINIISNSTNNIINNNLNINVNMNDRESNDIPNLKSELDESKKKITFLNNYSEYTKTILEKSLKIIEEKDNEINQLRFRLKNGKKLDSNNNPNYFGKNYPNNFKINFLIQELQINYSISCNENDIFATIEEKLYQIFSDYRETENFFLFEGKKILRFKTIKENNIDNGKTVIMIVHSEDN